MASGWIARNKRREIYQRDNNTCCYCDQVCVSTFGVSNQENIKLMRENAQRIATLDHIISQWEIAQTCESDAEFRREIKNPHNLVTVCNGCNSRKGKMTLYMFCKKYHLNYSAILNRIAERTGASC
jgi:5-methylcytosine-specific restriction endonuclease McrA